MAAQPAAWSRAPKIQGATAWEASSGLLPVGKSADADRELLLRGHLTRWDGLRHEKKQLP